jgi:O-antigen/teichoic acid export membrane protein
MPVSVPGPVKTTSLKGLRARMVRGAFFEVSGYGAQQVIRLGSNLILTRLLFPAAFGLASMVWVITTGLVMLSDVAIHACVIQSKRGDEPAFLNTAFTIQAMRGVGLTILMMGLAKPVAWFYREPKVEGLLYLGSLSMLFTGLHSTAVYTLRRRLSLGWVNGLEFTQTVFSTALTLALSWRYRSPWALIVGAISGSFFFAIASHFLPVENRNRFHWDKEAASEIRRFGSWVFGSSATTFLGGQSDRILLGRLLGASWLGIYSVATNLSDAIGVVINRLINGVMYPGLSQAGREAGSNISPLFYRMRLRVDGLSMTSTGLVAGMGGWIVHTLWDQRYSDASWILQILCVRLAISLLVAPSETCLFSLGYTRYGFFRSLTRLLGTLVLLPLGWYFAGVKGVIWGTVAAEIPTIFAVWPQSRRLGILKVRRELLSASIFLAAFALGHLASHVLPVIHLRRHSR